MSFGIIRIEKFKAADIRGIEIHDRRLSEESKTNPDIDKSRTEQNYSLHPPRFKGDDKKTFARLVNEKIAALKLPKKLRANVNVMLQALVTASPEFFEGKTQAEQMAFFQAGYDYLAEKYGKHNIISATVHMDEKTPHMHVNFVPVTPDGRLSAKEVYSPSECRKLQDEAFETVFQQYGLERGEVGEVDEKGYSKKKHVETQKMKAQQLEADKKQFEAYKVAETQRLEADKKQFEAYKERETKKLEAEKKDLEIDKERAKAINKNRANLYREARDAHKNGLIEFKKTIQPGDTKRTQLYKTGVEKFKEIEKQYGE